ncbi:hypothetical protein C8J30_1421 [Rhodobacter viridis]|uniref:Alpha/beta hydrolase n=1 Tax=Rhodobacter viridis TaxID=1054202 RepID=A0A318TM47_9RHOB|nr:alpha/beta hydrolase [Rhodobacter viridis]PYF05921.1 hypothetical protein C8J30_1421 [Rhodobacter viridis]
MTNTRSDKTREIGHSALVFFHGIGNPKKLGTLTTFLDEFDKYGSARNARNAQTLGVPRNFKHKIEEGKDGCSRSVIQFRRIKKFKDRDVQVKIVRSYEGYWGDDLVKPISVITFLFWLIKIIINSCGIAIAPWRRYPLYRIRSLYLVDDLFSGSRSREKLEALYRKFGEAPQVSRWPRGRIKDFISFLETKDVQKHYGSYTSVAREWFARERRALTDFACRMGGALIIMSSLVIAVWLTLWRTLDYFFDVAKFSSALSLGSATAVFFGMFWLLWQPIKQRISDVYFWTSYDERSNGFSIRERRIAQAESLILDVLENPRCNDCIVIGHSLGSAISMEAVFRIADKINALDLADDERQARLERFRKIKCVFLVGSPIDNIFSLFQEDSGVSRRYSRIQEQKAPSIDRMAGQCGFRGGEFAIVNIWSRFDPISARIFSLRTPANSTEKILYNSEGIPSGIPNPLSAHAGYFQDERVMGEIYRTVMTSRFDPSKIRAEIIEVKVKRRMYITLIAISLSLIAIIVANFMEFQFLALGGLAALGLIMRTALKWYARDLKECDG